MRNAIHLSILAAGLAAQSPQEDRRLVFSTLQGGDRFDDARAVTVAKDGHIYVTGESESRDLPADPVGGKPLTAAVFKGYLTRYSPDGRQLVWRKLIGGSSNTVPSCIASDTAGNVYVAGTTGARDLPLLKPIQDRQTGLNIGFLMKFSPQGELLFSTYFGGERNDDINAIALDSGGNIYIAGRATSTKFPVKNAIQAEQAGGGQDGFVAKITPDFELAWSTLLGGAGHTDNIWAIAVGPGDGVFVAGETMSAGLATEGAYIDKPVSYSSFVAKLAATGEKIEWLTYVGWKGGYTKAQALAVDSLGRAHVAGDTTSRQLTVSDNAHQKEFAGGFKDAFLLRLNPEGSSAEYLSYFGGSHSGPSDPDETATAIQVDHRGLVYLAGHTNSADFPSYRALQPGQSGVFDAFLLRLDLDFTAVVYATFWGGTKKDAALALALGPGETATIVGETSSDDLPLLNPLQSRPGSSTDAFVSQVCDPWPGVWFGDQPPAEFHFTIEGERPAPIEAIAYAGCPQPFPAEGPEVSESWLTVTADGGTVPMRLKIEVNPDGLEPGEYRTVIRIKVPDSYSPLLEIPVTFTVHPKPEPPAESPDFAARGRR